MRTQPALRTVRCNDTVTDTNAETNPPPSPLARAHLTAACEPRCATSIATPRARVGLLANVNVGCFVSKCVLWCFVVFCGCFVMFCGCFAGVLRVFCSISTQHTKNIEKHTAGKHKKLTIRLCIAGVFQEPKIATVLHKTEWF